MKDRDCESCKKFSRGDPHESEGYCEAKRTWVDPQEGEDCKMHEFTLWTATKYKDGTPIMSEPERVYCETDSSLVHGDTDTYEVCKAAKNSVYGITAEMSNQLDSKGAKEMKEFSLHLADKYKDGSPTMSDLSAQLVRLFKRIEILDETQDDIVEEYDAVLKTHGDTLEQHMERIEDLDDILATHAGKINAHTDALCDLEHLYEKILDDLCAMRDRLCKITDLLVMQDEFSHIFSNFCGNCTHAEMEDGLCTCALTGEALDPDSASCSRFDPSFTHMNECPDWVEKIKCPDWMEKIKCPDWMEKIRKDMTTPSEPTEGCKDCKCAVDGMCVKYNCSLGAICATPECHEPTPF